MAETPETPNPASPDTQSATAVLEPPGGGVPPTGTAPATEPPEGPRRKRTGLIIGILIAVLVLAGFVALIVWALNRGSNNAPTFESRRSAYESAMKKAGVDAPFPTQPVELTKLEPTGSHPFKATFTPEELSALINAFTYLPDTGGTSLDVSRVDLSLPGEGVIKLDAVVVVDGNGYSGSVSGPVEFKNGEIVKAGEVKVVAEGIPLGGDKAAQATEAVFTYVNDFLDAAPGLSVYKAEVTASGIAVEGSAPDAIKLP